MHQPNIVLITIDSLRADHVFTDAAATPTLEALAREGIAYECAFAQGPFTTFSMPSLFTSRYPSALSYITFSEDTVGVAIKDEPTITTALSNAGYETAGFHSNPLLSNLFGFDRGFDVFDSNLPFSNTDWLPGQAKILADKIARVVRTHAYIPAATLTNQALEWLDARSDDRPFFLWLHYMDVHGPYQSKSGFVYLNKYRGERLWRKAIANPEDVTKEEHKRLQELYREEIEYTDNCLNALVDGLRSRGMGDETLVVITADHGEQFFEHGHYSHPHQLYDELIHVPLVLNGPARPTANHDAIVELIDVAPTLIKAADSDVPDEMTGELLDTDTPREWAISEADINPAYAGCVRAERWKYLYDGTTNEESLFDLEADSHEQTDVGNDYPAVLEELSMILNEHVSSSSRVVGADADLEAVEVDDDVQNRLEDLGYL